MVGLRSWRVTVRVPRVNKKNDNVKKKHQKNTHTKREESQLSRLGFEPRILCSGGRCLIHWANGNAQLDCGWLNIQLKVKYLVSKEFVYNF